MSRGRGYVGSPSRRVGSKTGRTPEWAHALLWISPWIAGTLLFLVIPVALSAYYSGTEYSLIESPVPVGLDNYREMAHDPLVWTALRNTGLYTLFSVVLGTIASVAIAVLLEQRLRGSALVRALVFLPTMIPIVAASIGWAWLYDGEHGLFNALLHCIGVQGPDWLGDRRWALLSLVIMGLWSIGSAVVICTAALRQVPPSLYEAAAIDGMSAPARFRHVTLPMISPAVLFNAVMSTIWSLQVFAVPHIMTKGGPGSATLMYSMYVYRNAFEYGHMGYASALAWVQFLAAVVLTILALLIARRFVHYRTA
jgi:multiple sugar transport system permease protein